MNAWLSLPPGLDGGSLLALVSLSFFTSLITATFSMGGGSLLIAAMTLVLPPVVGGVALLLVFGRSRGRALIRTRRPMAQIGRGAMLALSALSFFTAVSLLPQAETFG